MQYRQKVLQGLSWTLSSRLVTQLFQTAFTIILARLLEPNQFGIIGMLVVFSGFAQVLNDAGLSAALIYRQDIGELHRSTVFWIQLLIGIGLTAIFFACAPAFASFYSEPQLAPLTRLICWIFTIQALGTTQYSILRKEFRFKSLAFSSILATFASGFAAIALALSEFGVWALAWQIVLFASANTIAYWYQSAWRPRFVIDRHAAADLWRYASYLLGNNAINYWSRNGDNLIVGKFLGAFSLGIYARSYSLMLLPLNNISAIVGQVFFPALSELQNDLPKFRNVYLKAIRSIALVTFPLMVGIAIYAHPLILLLLGAKWIDVVPILQVLTIVGLVQSIVQPVGWVYSALGKTKEMFFVTLFFGVCFPAVIWAATRYSVIGVAYAYATYSLISAWINLRVAGRQMDMSVWTMLSAVWVIFCLAIVMGALLLGIDIATLHSLSPAVRIGIGIPASIAIFIGLCVLAKEEAFVEVFGLVSKRLGLRLTVERR